MRPVSPVFRALCETLALPSDEVGPDDKSAFARFAATCLADDIGECLRFEDREAGSGSGGGKRLLLRFFRANNFFVICDCG